MRRDRRLRGANDRNKNKGAYRFSENRNLVLAYEDYNRTGEPNMATDGELCEKWQ